MSQERGDYWLRFLRHVPYKEHELLHRIKTFLHDFVPRSKGFEDCSLFSCDHVFSASIETAAAKFGFQSIFINQPRRLRPKSLATPQGRRMGRV